MATYNNQQQTVITGQPQSYGVPAQTAAPPAPPGYAPEAPPNQGIEFNKAITLHHIPNIYTLYGN